MEALRHEAESYNQSHITESDLSKEIDLALFVNCSQHHLDQQKKHYSISKKGGNTVLTNRNVERIINAITMNERTSRLASYSNLFERRKKARSFVVAECAAQKIKLSDVDISMATIAIVAEAAK